MNNHSHHHSSHEKRAHDFRGAFFIGVVLNSAFVILEVVFGFLSQSLALVADAGHNLADVLALLLAWGASILAQRPPTERRTYGFKSTSILAALFNAIFLLISVGAIAWEAIRRLHHPPAVAAQVVVWVALLGIVINGLTALLFFSGRKQDLNVRAAFLHMTADAAVSFGVVIAGLIILETRWTWLDPVVSLAIAIVIVWGTWGLLRDSVNLALQAVPSGIEMRAVRAYLAGLPHVTAVHDLHVWPMSTTETALTAHLVRDVDECDCELLNQAAHELQTRFQIHHSTIQFETAEHECSLASEGTV